MFGVVIAFKNYRTTRGIFGSDWVGVLWFETFFTDPYFWRLLRNTFLLSALSIVFGFPAPILLALMLNELRMRRYKKLLQTVYTFPHFLSWVIVGSIVKNLLSVDGVVNGLMAGMGLEKVSFLGNKDLFRPLIYISEIWKEAGWSSIIYLAAIMGIDTSLYEAATVDGCGRFRQIWYITLPCIRKIFVVLLILNVGKVLDAGFNQVYVFLSDEVRSSGEIIDTWVYTQGIGKMNYSLSTAVGLMKSVLSCVLVFGTNALARKWDSAIW